MALSFNEERRVTAGGVTKSLLGHHYKKENSHSKEWEFLISMRLHLKAILYYQGNCLRIDIFFFTIF